MLMSNKKDFTLTPRVEDVKDKKKVEVFNADFDIIKKRWYTNLEDIKEKFEITDLLLSGESSPNEKNASEDLWRFQIVFLTSSFDYLLHELIKFAMLKIYNDEFDKTKKYNKFSITMPVVEKLVKNPEDTSPLDSYINSYFGSCSFISKERFKEVLYYIGVDINKVANQYYSNEDDKNAEMLCATIDDICTRRHLIVHQCDKQTESDLKNEISKELVDNYIKVFENVSKIIIDEIQQKLNS